MELVIDPQGVVGLTVQPRRGEQVNKPGGSVGISMGRNQAEFLQLAKGFKGFSASFNFEGISSISHRIRRG